jgi:hypothetical protein
MVVKGNTAVAKAILDRLRDVHICLDPYLASPVEGLDSTLKGINFTCKDLAKIKQAFDSATDYMGRRAFYYNGEYSSGKMLKEVIRNAPDLLDISFGATDGYGYREIRDMPIIPSLPSWKPKHLSPSLNSRFGFEDEQSVSFDVSSLHAALAEKVCNIHIDNMGFTVRGPYGAFLNPDFGQHLVNELILQTDLAPYLGLGIGRVLKWTHLLRTDDSEAIGNWIAKNINLELPNFRNGYRPGVGVQVTPTPRLTISAKFTAKCSFCREYTDDLNIPVPDGWSIGAGLTYRFGK